MHLLILFLLHIFRPDPPIVVARDTTYITKPLRPNGLPDYERYVLDRDRQGVTPENNAAVLLWQAMWPQNLDKQDYEPMRAELGLKQIPSSGAALQLVDGKANERHVAAWLAKQGISTKGIDAEELIWPAIDHPWTSKQLPPLAEWVDANKRPLDLISQASRRPRYYSPSPTLLDANYAPLVAILMPGAQNMRHAAESLAFRAVRELGENRLSDAWSDLLAIHRLGCLQAQAHNSVGQFVAMSITERACHTTLALLSSDRLTLTLARQVEDDLNQLPPASNINESIDHFDRLSALDTVIYVRHDGLKAVIDPMHLHGPDPTKYLPVDCNVALRNVKYWFDRVVATMQLTTGHARKRSYQRVEAELQSECRRLHQPPQIIAALVSMNKRSELIGTYVAKLMMPGIDGTIFADRVETELQLTQLAAGLSVFRAENGSYPAKLSELVPSVLKKLPIDVYNSKEFVYKRTSDGYLLYSVGDNGADDGGSYEKWKYHGRVLDDMNDAEKSVASAQIPSGADDVAIRTPRPSFKLSSALKSTSGAR